MGFEPTVKIEAMLASKRHCVLCEKSKGKKIECHHIVPQSEKGQDTFDNCIPLCFDCHEEVGSYNVKHPKGTKYTAEELKKRRDIFYKRVENGEFPKYEYSANQNDSTDQDMNKIKEEQFTFYQKVFRGLSDYYNTVEDEKYKDEELFEEKANLAVQGLESFVKLGDKLIKSKEFKSITSEYRIKFIDLLDQCKSDLKYYEEHYEDDNEEPSYEIIDSIITIYEEARKEIIS